MKQFYILSSILIFSIVNYSCTLWGNCEEGKGNIVEEVVSLDRFSKIDLSGASKVFLKQGNTQSVSIKAPKNIIALLNTEISGEEWDIEFEKCIKTKKDVEIYIQIPEINELSISGSGEILGDGVIESDKLQLGVKGSGEMKLQLEVKELESDIAGSGDLILSGRSKLHDISIKGSGDVAAFDLLTDESEVDIKGSGDVKLTASYALNVNIKGSGDVLYKGDVKKIDSDIVGSGSLRQAD